VESYKQNDLCQGTCDRADVRLPIIIAGDFNGGPRGSVYKFIRSQNYRCAAEDVFARKWVTHKSHLNHDVAVDHVRLKFTPVYAFLIIKDEATNILSMESMNIQLFSTNFLYTAVVYT
jgi:hypothetical protein